MAQETGTTLSKESKKKKIILVISSILCSIAFLSLLFSLVYFPIVNKPKVAYENLVKTSITNLNSLNESTVNLITSNSLDTENLKLTLPKITKEMKEIKTKLINANIPNTYDESHYNLLEGIDNNIKMYNEILSIVNNPTSNDLELILKDLRTYESNTINSYFIINNGLYNISLDENCLKFIDVSISYTNEEIQKNSAIKITQKKTADFIKSMENIIYEFQNIIINSNIENDIYKIRQGNYTYIQLIDNCTDAQNKVSNLKSQLSRLSIPSEGEALSNNLNNILNEFDLYLQNSKHILVTEDKISQSSEDFSELDKLYIENNASLNNLEKNMQNFLKSFSSYKVRLN